MDGVMTRNRRKKIRINCSFKIEDLILIDALAHALSMSRSGFLQHLARLKLAEKAEAND